MYSLPSTTILKMCTLIQTAIKAEFSIETPIEDLYFLITETPNKEMGHFAFPCFSLSKTLRKGPPQIASLLQKRIESSPLGNFLATGPYLNLTINGLALNDVLKTINNSLVKKPETIMFEYSQPNTHKELHVGHMRNLCLGNALVRLNRAIGHKVIATTYPGDVGTHVAKTLWYLKNHYHEKWPDADLGTWLGKMYTLANNKLEDELGTEKEAKNRSELTAILKELEEKKGPFFEMWKKTREYSLELFKETYKWADIEFDRWFFESEVDSESLLLAKKYYEEGKLTLSDGAIGMDLSAENLGFCLLIKSDGTGLYATKDIMLAQKKFSEFGLDRSIYLVDKRQAFHFQQVFKVLEKLGFPHAKDCYHLEYDFVELPSGAMSSRKGNIVPLKDLIHQMEATITANYLEKYRGTWSDSEIAQAAKLIAEGAIKFGMIRLDNNKKIVFEMSEWVKLDGETGPYLQYVHARISSLLEKQGFAPNDKIDASLLTKPVELELIAKLTRFNDTVLISANQFKTGTLCSYLYDLGKLFNQFYIECPIGKADNEELKKARLSLAHTTKVVMNKGLSLLGITAPNRM